MTLVDQRTVARPTTGASLTPLVLIGTVGLALVLVLSWTNLSLRGDMAREGRTLQTLQDTLDWNLRLSALERESLPVPLAESLQADLEGRLSPETPDTLLVVYTPTVCLSCLKAGLGSLTDRRSELAQAGIAVHALIGEHRGTSQSALLLQDEGLLSFPFTLMPADTVLDSLPFGRERGFTDTPLYLVFDRDLEIHSVFKADQQRPELLDRWLETLSRPLGGSDHAR